MVISFSFVPGADREFEAESVAELPVSLTYTPPLEMLPGLDLLGNVV
jgi:hypothetical protein